MIVVIVVFLLVKPPYTIQIETTSKKFRILNNRYLPDEKNRQRSEPGDCKEQTKVSRTQAQSNSRGLFKQAYLGGTFHVFILTPPALTGSLPKSDM